MLEKLEINNTCIFCDNCRLICPENAVLTSGSLFAIDEWSCTQCGLCIAVCPTESIKIIETK